MEDLWVRWTTVCVTPFTVIFSDKDRSGMNSEVMPRRCRPGAPQPTRTIAIVYIHPSMILGSHHEMSFLKGTELNPVVVRRSLLSLPDAGITIPGAVLRRGGVSGMLAMTGVSDEKNIGVFCFVFK